MAWQVADGRAILELDSFVGQVHLSQLHQGCQIRFPNDAFEIDSLFGFGTSEPVVETYVRGADLISRYQARESDAVSYQSYYRALPDSNGLEFILSAQTNLLHSDPLAQVASAFQASEVMAQRGDQSIQPIRTSTEFGPGDEFRFFLLRPQNAAKSLVLFAQPGDFHRAAIRVSKSTSISFWVFPAALEKGVIRRASLQLGVIPRRDDEQLAEQLVSSAIAAAPPLSS